MEESTGLLNNILPPRLEDAGLEDCALPPDSIKEAFFKAASAVKSRATSVFSDDEESTDCVQDPWPDEAKEVSDEVVVGGESPESAVPDSLVGVNSGKDAPGPCVAEKNAGVMEEGGDKVMVVGGDDGEERGEDKGCVSERLKGLKIGDRKGENDDGEEELEEEKEEGQRPILTEGYM